MGHQNNWDDMPGDIRFTNILELLNNPQEVKLRCDPQNEYFEEYFEDYELSLMQIAYDPTDK